MSKIFFLILIIIIQSCLAYNNSTNYFFKDLTGSPINLILQSYGH
jgi:hypothetical protein